MLEAGCRSSSRPHERRSESAEGLSPVFSGPVLWGRRSALAEELAVARSCHKTVNGAVYQAIARDLSSIIDRGSALQIPRRALRDEGVEVGHYAVFPDPRLRVSCDPVYRKADDLASVVNG